MLQEAEANMLRGIPSIEVAVDGGIMPSPAAASPATPATEERVEKPKPSAPTTQGQRSSLHSCSHTNTLSVLKRNNYFVLNILSLKIQSPLRVLECVEIFYTLKEFEFEFKT